MRKSFLENKTQNRETKISQQNIDLKKNLAFNIGIN